MGNRVYIRFDLHWGHGHIIKYRNRSFADMEEMNKSLLHVWRVTVKPGDTVINLGDISRKLNKADHIPGMGRDFKILIITSWRGFPAARI